MELPHSSQADPLPWRTLKCDRLLVTVYATVCAPPPAASRVTFSECSTPRFSVSVLQQVRLPQLRLLHEGIKPPRHGAGLPPASR